MSLFRTGGERRFEGVEIDHHQIDEGEPMGRSRREMRLGIAPGQNAGVDCRVQGLDAPVHDLGEMGDRGDFGHGNARGGERLGRTACGDQRHPAIAEEAGEVDQAGLVGDGNEGPANRHIVHGTGTLGRASTSGR